MAAVRAAGVMAMPQPRRAVAACSIALLILLLYGRTLGYSLVWDDFAALRARPAADLLGAWTGAWEPHGVWPEFYRPLSILLYDTLYRVFGHATAALHALNLAMLFAAAWMLRAFVQRETASAALALTAALLLVLHPETPASLAAWISQQFQLAALIASLGAMLVWQRVRNRGDVLWVWILPPLTIGALIKEDVAMLAPALLVWQSIRTHIVGDVPRVSRRVVWMMACWLVAYGVWRTVAIGGIGGYGWPTPDRLLLNVIDGPLFAFAMQWIPSAHLVSIVTGEGLAVIAVLAWRFRREARPELKTLALCGIALGVCANAPLLLVSGHTRLYLMILASALTLTAAVGVIAERIAAAPRALSRDTAGLMRSIILVALTAWTAAVGFANWTHTSTFAPCAPETVQRNTEVLSWDIVGAEVRASIAHDIASCRAMAARR